MPIYEFYCARCHRVYNFLSKSINTTKRPACPKCGRPELDRKVSRFAISKGRTEESGADEPPADFDEAKLERALAEMGDLDESSEDDPRQMARMMRTLCGTAGMPMNSRMEEAIRRMEAGEDPDKIEEEMGDLLDEEEPLAEPGGKLRSLVHRLRPPEVDDTLYDL